jgi:hypothetical protein
MLSPGPATAAVAPRPLAAALALPAIVLALALAGVVLAAGVLRTDSTPASNAPKVPKGGFAIGDSAFTSFGAVAVEAVDKTNGPTAKSLSGVTHGIQGLIPPNKTQVETFTTMTNLTGKPVQYSPAQFSLLVGSKNAKPLPLTTASIKPGVLQPNASIDARITFVVPRKGQKLWVRFKDPGRRAPFVIDLGRVTKTPEGALTNYHRH